MVTPVVALSGLLPRGRGTLEPIHQMLEGIITETLPDASWPTRRTWIVATDYSTGRRVVFGREGDPEASLADAVCASCAIPAWYAPMKIGGSAYIDGGTRSNASVDLLREESWDEVFVLAPMAAVVPDSPRSPVAMVERRVRKAITRGITHDVDALRQDGAAVTLLTPGREDLEVMGANLMNPRRRAAVLHTSIRTTAMEIRRQHSQPEPGAEAGTA
jgi:NTE family protein